MQVTGESVSTVQMPPNELYPLTMLTSINPYTLKRTVEYFKEGMDIDSIKGIEYKGDIYILDGYYEMLAANILKKDMITVELVDRSSLPFWNNDKNVEETLEVVGISTLYDFEGIGNFTYDTHPDGYRRK